MVDIEKKLKLLEDSSIESAKNDFQLLQDKINNNIQEKTSENIDNYRDALADKYENEVNKIIRNFNKEVFEYEKASKMKIINFKENLINNLKSKIRSNLEDFVKSPEYKDYLIKNIKTTLEKAYFQNSFCKVYIVERDFYLFKDDILSYFNIQLDKITNSNIGGCLVINEQAKISIDNTIKNNIEEFLDKLEI